jgi:hypothetical protein
LLYAGDRDGFVRMLVEDGSGFDVALPAATRIAVCFNRAGKPLDAGSAYPVTVRTASSAGTWSDWTEVEYVTVRNVEPVGDFSAQAAQDGVKLGEILRNNRILILCLAAALMICAFGCGAEEAFTVEDGGLDLTETVRIHYPVRVNHAENLPRYFAVIPYRYLDLRLLMQIRELSVFVAVRLKLCGILTIFFVINLAAYRFNDCIAVCVEIRCFFAVYVYQRSLRKYPQIQRLNIWH